MSSCHHLNRVGGEADAGGLGSAVLGAIFSDMAELTAMDSLHKARRLRFRIAQMRFPEIAVPYI